MFQFVPVFGFHFHNCDSNILYPKTVIVSNRLGVIQDRRGIHDCLRLVGHATVQGRRCQFWLQKLLLNRSFKFVFG